MGADQLLAGIGHSRYIELTADVPGNTPFHR
jgi:hypothetical protein